MAKVHSEFRVLVVEDDGVDRLLIKRAFQRADDTMHLSWATLVGEAVRCLQDDGYDIIVTDLSLPDSSGVDTVVRLREVSADTPIIVVSGLEDPDTAAELISLGVEDCFVKGDLSPSMLNRAIRHSIQRHANQLHIRNLLKDVRKKTVLLEEKNRKLAKLYAQAHDFVDNVSHEFRTPLTVVKEYISLVRNEYVGEVNEEQVRLLGIAEDRADDLNTMVDDMLDISRLESGMLCVYRRGCKIGEIVDRVFHSLQQKASVKKIDLQWEIDSSETVVYCDPEKASRVITNLVVNAIKFSDRNGIVKVSVAAEPVTGDVRFSISDNGPGIDEEALRSIFQRFKQLEQSVRSSTRGFGLGLNIAKDLVLLNFGSIDVQSAVGEGTEFSFTVPLWDPPSVVQRYLGCLEERNAEEVCSGLSLVLVEGVAGVEEKRFDDLDGFMNFCLRRNDLMFRLAPGQWLMLVPVDEQGLQDCQSRIRNEFEAANRNRPFGPLPPFGMTSVGSYQMNQQEGLIQKVAELDGQCAKTISPG